MGSSLFWDVTQLRMIVTDISGQPTGPIFKGQALHEVPKRRYLTTNQRCVTSRKNEGLKRLADAIQVSRKYGIHSAAEHRVSVRSRMT